MTRTAAEQEEQRALNLPTAANLAFAETPQPLPCSPLSLASCSDAALGYPTYAGVT